MKFENEKTAIMTLLFFVPGIDYPSYSDKFFGFKKVSEM